MVQTTYWYCPQIKWVAKYRTREQADTTAPFISSESVLTQYFATH